MLPLSSCCAGSGSRSWRVPFPRAVVSAGSGYGGAARLARVLRRRLRVFGGSPAAARRVFSSCRAFHAVRIRWLRTMSRQVTASMRGASPIRRHQPRRMSLLAGALAVAKPRSAAGRGGGGGGGGAWLRGRGGGFLGGGEDLGPVPVQPHRGGPERAADLAHGGGTLDPVVPVGIIAGEAAELVAGELGGPGVVRGGLVPGRAAGQRAEFQQGAGRGRAVQVAVGDDGAVVGALGAAVVRVQVLDQGRAGGPERDRPGVRVAVRVAGIGEDITKRDAGSGHRRQDRDQGADRVVPARRHGGTAGEFGHGGSVLVGHRDAGRQVVAVEQLVFAAQQVVL